MKLLSKTSYKLITLVAAAIAGLAIASPAKALDNPNSPVGNLLSQGAPPADVPPGEAPPVDAPPPAPTDVPPPAPTDAPPPAPTDAPPPPTEETTPPPAPVDAPTTPPAADPPEKGSWRCLNNPNPACK